MTITITNPTAGVIVATLNVVDRTGATIGTLMSARDMAPGASWVVTEPVEHVLEAGGTLQLQGNGLEYVVSSTESVQ
jgi:hypothetical protein